MMLSGDAGTWQFIHKVNTIKRKELVCTTGDLHAENLTCIDVTRGGGGGGYYQLATRARATCMSRWYSYTLQPSHTDEPRLYLGC